MCVCQRFQRFQHCKVSPKLPVLPTNKPSPWPERRAGTPGKPDWDPLCLWTQVVFLSSPLQSASLSRSHVD